MNISPFHVEWSTILLFAPFAFHLFVLFILWFRWSSGEYHELEFRFFYSTLLNTLTFIFYVVCFSLVYFGIVV